MIVVGLAGRAESGKDTAASMIEQWCIDHDMTSKRLAFADPVKQMAEAIDPLIDVIEPYRLSEHLACIVKRNSLDVETDTGWRAMWDEAKKTPDVRRLLQRIGTDAGRRIIKDDLWTSLMVDRIREHSHFDVIIITDARFANEQTLVKDHDGCMILVERPVSTLNTDSAAHVSENSIDASLVDTSIVNDGSLDDLQRKIISVMNTLPTE